MSTNQEKQTLNFQTEVKELLHLMINSLYSNKEIVLRELISNASDAADKLKYAAYKDSKLYEDEPDLKVWVEFDKDKRTLTIRDNGIGMTKEEAIEHLGTIAKSGTKEFISSLTGDKAKDSKLIGQFGVGFYSSFIIADKVTVISRKAGAPKSDAVKWISAGKGEYDIETVSKDSRGTEIILHLKDGEDEFLNGWHLRHLITKYSDHIDLPVVMYKEKIEENNKDKKDDVIDVPEEEVVNKAKALWTCSKQEVKEEEYKEFYKHVAHDFEDPLTWSHNKVEGKLEYTSLLYIPARAPFDLFQPGKARGLKLYVQRVFIMDDAEVFLPSYLRFMKGILDSKDLPLNVSREILQSNKTVDSIRSALIKRTLNMLESLAKNDKEKYQKFWKEFGQVIKEGPAEDFANKEAISKLLRFASTNTDSEEQNVSLEDYIARMPKDQDKIYYIAADTFNAAKNSPHLEVFRKKGIEVLLLSDRIDEWLMSHLTEFQGKKLQSVAKGGLELGKLEDKEDNKKQEETSKEFKEVVDKIKDTLKDEVKDVRTTSRLVNSPACIVADENDMTPQMERLLKAAGQEVPHTKPILELNPEHPMVLRLKSESDKGRFEDLSKILLDQAILAEGGQLNDPATFVKRFNDLLLELAG